MVAPGILPGGSEQKENRRQECLRALLRQAISAPQLGLTHDRLYLNHPSFFARFVCQEANEVAVDGVFDGGAGDGGLFAADKVDEVGGEPSVSATVAAEGAVHVPGDVEIDLFLGVFVAWSSVDVADHKAAVFHHPLDLAVGPDEVDGARGPRRAPDQVVRRRAAVLELNADSLVVNDIVVAS